MIQPGFDEDLAELRNELDEKLKEIKIQEGKASAELGVERGEVLKLEHNAQYGHYFRVTLKEEKNVRGNKNYSIIEANKSGIKFRNGKLEQLNETFSDLTSRYEAQQKSIVQEMVGISAGYSDPMASLAGLLSRLDVVTGLAVSAVSAPTPYCRPRVTSLGSGEASGRLQLHPQRCQARGRVPGPHHHRAQHGRQVHLPPQRGLRGADGAVRQLRGRGHGGAECGGQRDGEDRRERLPGGGGVHLHVG